jgi:hypothetical protein
MLGEVVKVGAAQAVKCRPSQGEEKTPAATANRVKCKKMGLET